MQQVLNRTRRFRASLALNSLAVNSIATAALWGAIATTSALADPLPGEVLKFSQRPLDATPVAGGIFWGHDEASTAMRTADQGPYTGVFMADDFSDKVSQPVAHVTWWGSYLNNDQFNGVKKFLISFESDVPAGPNNPFSHPGQPLLNQVVTLGALAPASGTYTETLVSPGGAPLNERLFKYNAELKLPFPEQANTVYWLKIAALVDVPTDGPIRWGWHDRDYTIMDPLAATPPAVNPGEFNEAPVGNPFPVWHFQDDAVTGQLVTNITATGGVIVDQSGYQPTHYIGGVDGPTIIGEMSKDLAFELYYVPEPGAVGMMAVASVIALRRRAR